MRMLIRWLGIAIIVSIPALVNALFPTAVEAFLHTEEGWVVVDFAKLRIPGPRMTYTLRCDRCGEEDVYVVDLAALGIEHALRRNLRKCGGRLTKVAEKTE